MFEEILGRPATDQEAQMIESGKKPNFKVGDRVRYKNARNVITSVEAIVLFMFPHQPTGGQVPIWGARLTGGNNFMPLDTIELFTSKK